MKKYLLTGSIASMLLLAACGSEENNDSQVEELNAKIEELEVENEDLKNQLSEADNTDEETVEESTDEEEVAVEDETMEVNEIIVDDEQMFIELVSIEHTFDEMWDEERINVIFEVENKTETSKEMQPRSLSIDDRMVDEMIYGMSQEIEQGKSAQAVMTLEDYESNDLPELTGNLDMQLTVFDWDDMDAEDLTYDVNINLDDY